METPMTAQEAINNPIEPNENTNPVISRSTIGVAQTKKCKCCGEIKNLDQFRTYGKGYKTICIACERKNAGITEEFAKYQDKDLINELRARGWKGTLTHEQIIVKNITL